MSQSQLTALIADPSSAVRISIRQILEDVGVEQVDYANSIAEVRRKLSEHRFGLVLCEYAFGGEESGQDLLEELRSSGVLPTGTIFVMVTGERSYANVMGVAEEAPDEYVLKPIVARDLGARLEKAFDRRHALEPIHHALAHHKPDQALVKARELMASKSPWGLDAARLAAQILVRLGRFEEAAKLFRAVLARKDHPWAKFGLAKVSLRQGDVATAEKAMMDIIATHNLYLPVYGQLSDVYVAQERWAESLDIMEQALRISPNNARRLQQAGQIAYTLGDGVKSAEYLNRALRLSGKALALDYRSLFQLVALHVGSGATGDVGSLVRQMTAKLGSEGAGQRSPIGAWYTELAQAMESVGKKEPLAAIDRLQKLSKTWDHPDLTLDFALDYFAVVARLYSRDVAATLTTWLEPLMYRLMISKQVQELMQSRLKGCDALLDVVQQANDFITNTASNAAQHIVDGAFQIAADALVAEGLRTRNNRLLLAAAHAAAKCIEELSDVAYLDQVRDCLLAMSPKAPDIESKRLLATKPKLGGGVATAG